MCDRRPTRPTKAFSGRSSVLKPPTPGLYIFGRSSVVCKIYSGAWCTRETYDVYWCGREVGPRRSLGRSSVVFHSNLHFSVVLFSSPSSFVFHSNFQAQTVVLGLLVWAMCIYSSLFYLALHLLISFKAALGWLLLSPFFHVLPAFLQLLMFYPCFFMVLEHLYFYLIFSMFWHPVAPYFWSCFWSSFLYTFYLVKCTFLQNIVNYDAWHTCGSLPVAGAALESCFDVLTVFFHGFGTPTFLPRVFHVLASCCSILVVLFLVFIFVHFYLVKLAFLQNIVNYDAWHTFGSLPVAGAALESCFDVLTVFFHGFGTPTFLPRVFHVLASCCSILLVLFLVFIFVHFYLVKCTFLQNIVNYDAWHTFGSLPVPGPCMDIPLCLPWARAGWWHPLLVH